MKKIKKLRQNFNRHRKMSKVAGIDELWIFFLLSIIVLIIVFVVLRREQSENYGDTPQLPKFQSSNAERSDYQELNAPNGSQADKSRQVPSPYKPTPAAVKLNNRPSFSNTPNATKSRPQEVLPATPKSTYFDGLDATDPDTYTNRVYRPNVPVTLRHPLHAMADPYRGDIEVAPREKTGWFDNRYDGSALYHKALFSPQSQRDFAAASSKYQVGSRVVNEELIMS